MISADRYNFASYWVDYNSKYDLFSGNRRVLREITEKYNINLRPPFCDTTLTVVESDQVAETDLGVEETRDYEKLRSLKLKIVAVDSALLGLRNRQTQKITYAITHRDNRNFMDFGMMPKNHFVEIDRGKRRARVIGQNALPRWYTYVVKKEAKDRHIPLDNPYLGELELYKSWMPYKEEIVRKIKVGELPFIVTENNELVCLAETTDEPVIGIVGQRGKGKSLCLHTLVDHGFWKMGRKVAVMNDYLRECGTWCLPWPRKPENKKFISQLERLNEQPMPLPCIYLHPNTKNLNYITHQDTVGFKISLPFKDTMNNFEYMMRHIPEWKITKSLPYLKKISKQLIECKSFEEIESILESEFADKSLWSIRDKIMSVLNDIYQEQIWDISNDINSDWTIKNKRTGEEHQYSPFMAAMLCDLVPVFVPTNIRRKMYFPMYFRYVAEDIFYKQEGDELCKNKDFKVWLAVDELTSLDSRNNPTVASQILDQVVAEGRSQRIGFLWVSQNPELITQRIATNTTHFFSFQFQEKKQAQAIGNNFAMAKYRINEILKLKKYEVLAMTTENFIVYDENGKRSKSEPGETFRGFFIPSLSMHRAPSQRDM